MTRTQELIYLTLYWRNKAFGYPPPLDELAEKCRVSQTHIKEILRQIARAGYIRIAFMKDGSYSVKFNIEPKRPWVVNITTDGKSIVDVKSEIPVMLYVWTGRAEPLVYFSKKDLDKAELIKKGILP